jgi:hypothetical protein
VIPRSTVEIRDMNALWGTRRARAARVGVPLGLLTIGRSAAV